MLFTLNATDFLAQNLVNAVPSLLTLRTRLFCPIILVIIVVVTNKIVIIGIDIGIIVAGSDILRNGFGEKLLVVFEVQFHPLLLLLIILISISYQIGSNLL